MTTRMVVAAAFIGAGLIGAAVSWGKAIWQEFNDAIDESFDAEVRQLFDQDGSR